MHGLRDDQTSDVNYPVPPARCVQGLLKTVWRMSLDSWAQGFINSRVLKLKGRLVFLLLKKARPIHFYLPNLLAHFDLLLFSPFFLLL